MIAPDGSIAQAFPRATAVGRHVAAIAVAGVFAALGWLFILHEGQAGRILRATWTQHDFADGLGHAVGAKDTARAGLFLTLGLGVIVAGAFALIDRRLPGRGLLKGLSLATLLFVAWGLLFTPLIDSRQVQPEVEYVYLPTGAFGLHAGRGTIISGAVASVIAGLIIARIVPLMREARWWQTHAHGPGGLGADIGHDLLELAEQGAEPSGERAP